MLLTPISLVLDALPDRDQHLFGPRGSLDHQVSGCQLGRVVLVVGHAGQRLSSLSSRGSLDAPDQRIAGATVSAVSSGLSR